MTRAFPLWRQLLQLNVLLAAAGASIAAAGSWLGAGTVSWTGCLVAFAVTFAVYNFDRIADDSPREGRSTPQRAATLRSRRGVLRVLLPVAAVFVVIAGVWRGPSALVWSLAMPLAGLAYVLPILPLGPWRRAKDIPYLKCFYVAASWCTFVGVGVSYAGGELNAGVICLSVLVGARMFAGTYLGDIRDLDDDAAAGMSTIASRLGAGGSHRLLAGVHTASFALVVACVWGHRLPLGALGLLPAMALATFLYARFRRKPHDSELILELYDLEMAAFGPILIALA